MFGLKDILRSPDSLEGGGDVGQDVALLESDEPITTIEEEEEEETPEEGEEGEETEEEEEEEVADDSKPILPHERPTITDLKKDFPELLKKYPSIREVIYREKRYDEEFGDIETAVKAKEDAESFNNLHTDIFNGNGTKFFESIKAESPESLRKFAAKILPTLFKVDEDAHWTAVNPAIALVLRSFLQAGKDNEDVKKGAELFAKFMFGDNAQGVLDGKITFTTAEAARKEEDPEVAAFRAERKSVFLTDVAKQAESGLRAMVLEKNKAGKLLLDPDDEFSPYLRQTVVKNIMDEISRQIKVDASHMKYASSLLKKAEDAKFPSEAKDSIINAYLSRARQLVKKVRLQVVSEVRGDKVPNSERVKRVVDKSRQPEAGGGGRLSKTKSFTPGQKVDYKKYSDEDIINDNW